MAPGLGLSFWRARLESLPPTSILFSPIILWSQTLSPFSLHTVNSNKPSIFLSIWILDYNIGEQYVNLDRRSVQKIKITFILEIPEDGELNILFTRNIKPFLKWNSWLKLKINKFWFERWIKFSISRNLLVVKDWYGIRAKAVLADPTNNITIKVTNHTKRWYIFCFVFID